MNPSLKRTLLSAGGALGGALVTLLLRRYADDDQASTTSNTASAQAAPAARSSGLRGQLVDLASDILAETYRKLRLEPKERKR